MDKRAYWVWLQHSFQPGSSKPRAIYNRFNDLEKFYKEGIKLWSTLSFVTEKDLTTMGSFTVQQAEAALEYAEKMGQQVITPECEEYPANLWNIPDPPAVLYVKGTMPDMDNTLVIGMVGSRKAKDSVFNTAEKIAYELSTAGTVIVSGGAVGVDAASHRGAMMSMGPTVAVLGCGLDFPYLMENELLRQRILTKGGALVSEYPPGTGVQKGTFQTRNRIISGMSNGVVIVAADKKSGTMITARRATEQNRDIFAVPGDPNESTSYGPNSLIKDGAVPVTSGADILEYYQGRFVPSDPYTPLVILEEKETLPLVSHPETVLPEFISDKGRSVFSVLSAEPKHVSLIIAETGLASNSVMEAITELELFDLVESRSGQRYTVKE